MSPLNPFMIPPVGTEVVVRWKCDERHGGQNLKHVGTIVECDDWIKIGPSGETNGELHVPITFLDSIVTKNNPFVNA